MGGESSRRCDNFLFLLFNLLHWLGKRPLVTKAERGESVKVEDIYCF
jgi:hypothetical protein